MKIGIITKTNSKGQIVIPKEYREELGIRNGDLLNIVISEKEIVITPVEEVYPKKKIDTKEYEKLLEKTKGIWAATAEEDKKNEKIRRRKEKKRLNELRNAW